MGIAIASKREALAVAIIDQPNLTDAALHLIGVIMLGFAQRL